MHVACAIIHVQCRMPWTWPRIESASSMHACARLLHRSLAQDDGSDLGGLSTTVGEWGEPHNRSLAQDDGPGPRVYPPLALRAFLFIAGAPRTLPTVLRARPQNSGCFERKPCSPIPHSALPKIAHASYAIRLRCGDNAAPERRMGNEAAPRAAHCAPYPLPRPGRGRHWPHIPRAIHKHSPLLARPACSALRAHSFRISEV